MHRIPTRRGEAVLSALAAGLLLLSTPPSLAQGAAVAPAYSPAAPTALAGGSKPLSAVAKIEFGRLDPAAIAAQDRKRSEQHLPMRYAIPHRVRVTPATGGTWETLADGTRMWRLRVRAPGATSLNLGFADYALPANARLLIYSADRTEQLRPFTDADNRPHGQLWTPVLLADDIVVELTLPKRGRQDVALTLVHVGQGYRGFALGKAGKNGGKNGFCDVDVVCPQAANWQGEVDAVGLTSIGGFLACTGFMVNNTATNERPLFMTAAHCSLDSGTAPTLVVYWNHQVTTCNGARNGHLRDFQTGSRFLAANGPTDFTLVELSASPNPAWNVRYAGWDRTGAATPGAVTIHHPATQEKAISFENDPTTVTSYYGNRSPGDGTHVRIFDWDLGSTEPGSSGAPLFDLNHRVIGQLHGGDAACNNNFSDWYGRFAASWNSGSSPATRLRDWLDPLGTGATTLDLLGEAMDVAPVGPVLHGGPVGGPFTNATMSYTLINRSSNAVTYSVSVPNNSLMLIDGNTTPITGTLPANGGNRVIRVTLAPGAAALTPGIYPTDITFTDTTANVASRKRHTLEVGRMTVYGFDLNQDPGWTRDAGWGFGVPQGGGGLLHGWPDPRSGKTGANVFGYNLAGDYTANLNERHLTTKALDCSGLTGVRVRFQRWLNVEESEFDHASFRASKDGQTWVTIWANAGEVVDTRWAQMDLDVSQVADGQKTVYLRWTMGTTDSDWEYSGWNIDDVEVVAIPLGYFAPYGTGCAVPAGQPTLSATGFPTPGGFIDLRIAKGAPNGGAGLFLALTPDRVGAFCLLLTPPLVGPVVLPLDQNGAASFSSALPVGSPLNVHVYAQAITFQGASWATTNGLDILLK